MKICIVCSAGGHFQEMEIIKSKFFNNDELIFYYSTKSDMYKDLLQKKKMYLVKDPKRNVFLNIWNFFLSFLVFVKEKPDVILSNGSSVAYPICLYGWLFRKKVVYIDSLTRVNNISLFGKLVKPFTTDFYVFWPNIAKKHKKFKLLENPLKKVMFGLNYIEKAKNVFVSVGSSKYNSDRLIMFADKLAKKYNDKKFFCQIGNSKYEPKNCKYKKYLSYSDFLYRIKTCDFFISYAGVGNILLSCKYKKPIYVIPRLKKYGEAVDDHQLELYKFIISNMREE